MKYVKLITKILKILSQQVNNYLKKGKKSSVDFSSSMYRAPGGGSLPKDILNELTQFTRKRSNAIIDVYWLYDDGGLTLLLPYIISTRRTWNLCTLRYLNLISRFYSFRLTQLFPFRVFALANKKDEIELELSSMASLLAKFRIDYSDLQLITDITKKPQESTLLYFNQLIKEFVNPSLEENGEITCLFMYLVFYILH